MKIEEKRLVFPRERRLVRPRRSAYTPATQVSSFCSNERAASLNRLYSSACG